MTTLTNLQNHAPAYIQLLQEQLYKEMMYESPVFFYVPPFKPLLFWLGLLAPRLFLRKVTITTT